MNWKTSYMILIGKFSSLVIGLWLALALKHSILSIFKLDDNRVANAWYILISLLAFSCSGIFLGWYYLKYQRGALEQGSRGVGFLVILMSLAVLIASIPKALLLFKISF